MNFIETHELLISTLSPVHIGCGEDYEPTNYVIDSDCLFPFDLAAVLRADPERGPVLMKQIEGAISLPQLQKTYQEKWRDACIGAAGRYVPMSQPAAQRCLSRIANGEMPLAVERTAYDTLSHRPIIPGSGLKGAIRGAVLEAVAKSSPTVGRPGDATAVEQELLGFSFREMDKDPFRLFKPADAHYVGVSPEPTIVLERKSRHRDNNTETSVKDISQYFPECVRPFLSRAFRAQLTFGTDRRGVSTKGLPAGDLNGIAKACNDYYLPRLKAQAEVFETLQAKHWLTEVAAHLISAVEENRGFLLRVGKHAGADYLTMFPYRRIRTKYQKNPMVDTLPLSITLCAVDNRVYPFGWVFVEICRSGINNPRFGLLDVLDGKDSKLGGTPASIRQVRFEETRRKSAEQQAAAKYLREQAESKRIADENAMETETQRRAAMTDNARKVEELRDRMTATQVKQKFGAELFTRLQPLLVAAQLEGSDWTSEERVILAKLILECALAKIDFPDKRAKDLKRLAQAWLIA